MKLMLQLFENARAKLAEAIYQGVNRASKKLKTYVPALALLAASPMAHALKISDLTQGQASEISAGVKLFLLLVAAAGICIAAASVISWIMAAKRQEPAKWQLFGTLGGAAAVVVPVIILAFAGSLTGEQGNADQVFSDLQIDN